MQVKVFGRIIAVNGLEAGSSSAAPACSMNGGTPMPSAAILDLKKALNASASSKIATAESAAVRRDVAAEAMLRRRELAMLLRSIKTLVRQSP